MIDATCTYLYSHHYTDAYENVSVLFMYVKLDGFSVRCDAVEFDRWYQCFGGTCCARRNGTEIC